MQFPLPHLLCQSRRLNLRRFHPSDGPAVFAYSQEASTKSELPDEVFDSLDETLEIMDGLNANADMGDFPIVYCVSLRANDHPIGHVSLSLLNGGSLEIGYAIGEAYQGQGLGSEATDLFTRWALTEGGLKQLYAIVKESNIPSIRCVEKAGYRLLRKEERECFGGRYLIREYVQEAE